MRKIILFLMLFLVNYMIMAQKKELTADEKQVIIHKGTERPFTGKYYDFKKRLFEKTARAIKSYFFQYTAHTSYNGRLYGGSYVDCQCHLSSQR